MYDLATFTLKEMTECGTALRHLGAGAQTMEAAARQIVLYLYETFGDPKIAERSFALVRLFKTHAYEVLEADLQAQVTRALGMLPESLQMKCLTLLATVGDRPEWNHRKASMGHQAIPLVSEAAVAQTPMVAQLIQQFGLDIATVLQPDPALLVDLEQKAFNVFHVGQAKGSPYVPAQAEFVLPYGIQSVLGFGSMLPSGNLLAAIMFSKVPISRNTADLFKTLALNTKLALMPFEGEAVFNHASSAGES